MKYGLKSVKQQRQDSAPGLVCPTWLSPVSPLMAKKGPRGQEFKDSNCKEQKSRRAKVQKFKGQPYKKDLRIAVSKESKIC